MDKRNFLISSFLFGALMVSAAQCSSRRADRSGAQTGESSEAVAHFEKLKGVIVELAKQRSGGNEDETKVGDLHKQALEVLQSLGVEVNKFDDERCGSGGLVGSLIGILKNAENFKKVPNRSADTNIFAGFFTESQGSEGFDSKKMDPEFTLEALRKFVSEK